MIVVKVNDDVMAKLGATQADFGAKVLDLVSTNAQLTTDMAEKTVGITDLSARIDAIEAKIAALPAAAPGLSADEIKTLAAAEASRITAEAMAATGTSPLKPAPTAPVAPTAKDLIAAGKYEEAYNASEELRAEFDSVASFKAYAEAEKAGAVRITKK